MEAVDGRSPRYPPDTERHAGQSDNSPDDRDGSLLPLVPIVGPPSETRAARWPDRNWQILLHNGVSVEEERPGHVQTPVRHILRTNDGQPDPRHHHEQIGQAEEGVVRGAAGQVLDSVRGRRLDASERGIRVSTAYRIVEAMVGPLDVVRSKGDIAHTLGGRAADLRHGATVNGIGLHASIQKAFRHLGNLRVLRRRSQHHFHEHR